MESLILGYLLFAFTTAIASCIILLRPALQEIQDKSIPVVEHWVITYFTFFCIVTLFAPLLVFTSIVPSLGEKFRVALIASLTGK